MAGEEAETERHGEESYGDDPLEGAVAAIGFDAEDLLDPLGPHQRQQR